MGIGVFLYSCMFLQYYLLEDGLFFFVMPIVFHVGHAAVAIKKIFTQCKYAVKDSFEFAEEI